MAQRVRKPRTVVSRRTGTQVEDSRTNRERTRTDADRAAIEAELDDILDDIDSVLEENAAEFVAQYVQKGGQ